MRILFIPDIHNKTEIADEILSKESRDIVVFAGDEFDSFGDCVELNVNTARWLKKSLHEKDRIHLMANHTLPYAYPFAELYCSGFSFQKMFAIRGILKEEDFDKFRMSANIGGILFTHAGITKPWLLSRYQHIFGEYYSENLAKEIIEKESSECHKCLKQPVFTYHPFMDVGFESGGRFKYGGPFWHRPSYFSPLDGIPQIFGHTPQICKFNAKIGFPSFYFKQDSKIKVFTVNDIRDKKSLKEKLNEKQFFPKGFDFNICADTHMKTYLIIDVLEHGYEVTVKPTSICFTN